MGSKKPVRRKTANKIMPQNASVEVRPPQLLKESAAHNFANQVLRAYIYCKELNAAVEASRPPAPKSQLPKTVLLSIGISLLAVLMSNGQAAQFFEALKGMLLFWRSMKQIS